MLVHFDIGGGGPHLLGGYACRVTHDLKWFRVTGNAGNTTDYNYSELVPIINMYIVRNVA